MEKSSWKPGLVLIDLAVPRDIDPEIDKMDYLELYDIDDFKKNTSFSQNKAAYEQAETILQEHMTEFYEWLQGRDIIPRIKDVQEHAVEDLNLRLHKILAHLPLGQEERESLQESMDTAAGKVVGKIIFGMRDSMDRESFLRSLESMERVYDNK
jgi:glutamyl-tRNA reductase